MAAYDAGVPIYAGSDGGGISRHGNIAGEVVALHRTASRPTTRSAPRAGGPGSGWATPGSSEGESADFVVYPSDPLADLSVLRRRAGSCCAASSWPELQSSSGGRGAFAAARSPAPRPGCGAAVALPPARRPRPTAAG